MYCLSIAHLLPNGEHADNGLVGVAVPIFKTMAHMQSDGKVLSVRNEQITLSSTGIGVQYVVHLRLINYIKIAERILPMPNNS